MKLKSVFAIFTITMVLTNGLGFAADQKLRVCGSFASLTMFRNFEKPFWTEVVPNEMGFNVSLTSLDEVKLKGAGVLRQMEYGVFDVVHTVADYVSGDSPALAGLDLPALASDIKLAREVVEAYRPIMDKYLQKDFHVKLLSITPYPAQVLFLRDKISSLGDLRGKKIRCSGWTTAEFVRALKATGVLLHFEEVPESLKRGVVDGAITGSLSGYAAGWGDVADYLYPLAMGGWDYVIGSISMNTWQNLSTDQQENLMKLVKEKLEDPAWRVTERETGEGVQCLTGGKCPHGRPNQLALIPVTEEARKMAYQVLLSNVLPAWANKVAPEVVKEWNDSIGKVVGLKAK